MNRQSQRLQLAGACGPIEALRDDPPSGLPLKGLALLAHPHPLHGGSMDNKVVQTLARAYVECGWAALRFNFRGVGASAGSYDEGRGEVDDMLALVPQLAPTGRLAIGGFSFGAFVASHAAVRLWAARSPHSIVLVGTAAGRFAVAPLPAEAHLRTLVLHGEQDDTVALADVFDWARPQKLPVTVIPGGGHFFHGQLHLLKTLVVRHLHGLP